MVWARFTSLDQNFDQNCPQSSQQRDLENAAVIYADPPSNGAGGRQSGMPIPALAPIRQPSLECEITIVGHLPESGTHGSDAPTPAQVEPLAQQDASRKCGLHTMLVPGRTGH